MIILKTKRAAMSTRSPMSIGLAAAGLMIAGVLAGCGDDDADQAAESLAIAEGDADTSTDAEPTTEPTPSVDKSAVLQEFIDRRNDGRVIASLDLATPEFAGQARARIEGLAAWNFRSEQAEPCEESPEGTFHCLMLEHSDFHAVGGLTPWKDQMTVTINDAGLVSDNIHRIVDIETTVALFNRHFSNRLEVAHPDAAEKMTGVVMTRSFTAEDALIALQYVDEFVANSDEYPVETPQ